MSNNSTEYVIKSTREWTDDQLRVAMVPGPAHELLRTFNGNYTAVIRQQILVHIEVTMNVAGILPTATLTEADVCWLLGFFVQSIRDLSLSIPVVNRMNFRVWLMVGSSWGQQPPVGWVVDNAMEAGKTPLGTNVPGSFTYYRRSFQFDNAWNLLPEPTEPAPNTPSFTFGAQPAAGGATFGAQPSNPPAQQGYSFGTAVASAAPGFTFGAAPPQPSTSGNPNMPSQQTGGTGQQHSYTFGAATPTANSNFMFGTPQPTSFQNSAKPFQSRFPATQPAKKGTWGGTWGQ